MVDTIMVRQTKWISKTSAMDTKKKWEKMSGPKHFFQVKQNGSKYAVFARVKARK